MSGWAAKRFWKETTVGEADGGFQVLLDGRAVKTPAKSALIVPARALADAMAAEWDAQEDAINPNAMPVTRMCNSAIDKVSVQHAAVADMLAAYGDSDLLCYRATSPQELVARQAEKWDPILDWAVDSLDVRLKAVSGVMHEEQDAHSVRKLTHLVHALSPFQLTAFHDLVSMSGSLILAFAVAHGHLDAAAAWELSRLDELWQEELWGKDEEAQEMVEKKVEEFARAAWFFAAISRET
ncbi:Chaperone required for the assembly of the F1-ATPase [Aliiroseovarius halocynthiae]|uniref:ATPase n=1 Tax=Aliiroseovarius halocynthiae TaxID=985055 RepID=A0A545SXT2_9RHOB|nr:ATP12 family protein [Aliiroseovarius halocynthiae]TQV69770.1 ATPase [Aliiroseovarius halocynthiae]SMR81770.1 Chaperone required for the assembly of the F1-ATPase [Aliiroseovarius halocynthiae]